MRIELNKGCSKFAASDANVHLDIYTPQATIEQITPLIQQGLDVGWIILIDDEKHIDVVEAALPEQEEEEDTAAAEAEQKIKRPTSDKQCAGKTKTNAKCKKKALEGSKFCISHIPADELAELDAKLAAAVQPEETIDDVRGN